MLRDMKRCGVNVKSIVMSMLIVVVLVLNVVTKRRTVLQCSNTCHNCVVYVTCPST